MGWWYSLIAFVSAAYVFVGVAIIWLAIMTGNWVVIALACSASIVNVAVLHHAKKQDW